MTNPFSLITHWADHNPLAEQALELAVQQEIAVRRESKRYRRLVYYFFEKEIGSDTRKRLAGQYITTSVGLTDGEAQALVLRSSLVYSSGANAVARYEATRIINDYLLGQGDFLYTSGDADRLLAAQLLALLEQGNMPSGYATTSPWLSDVLLVLRARRHDCIIIDALLSGQYNYRSLVQVCGDHLGEFGVLPVLFDYLGLSWSSASLLRLLEPETQEQLRSLLLPQYELMCERIELLSPYGHQDMLAGPYATRFSRLGYYWSQQSRWLKILSSIAIIAISSLFGLWALLVMPVVWGILQGAGVARDYLRILGQVMTQWYRKYLSQHERYLAVYENMIDPEISSRDTLRAQQLMTRWYDILPCGGHELARDVQFFSQKCMHHLAQVIVQQEVSEDFKKDFTQIQAIEDRGKNFHHSLWVVSQEDFQEQLWCRFTLLMSTARRIVGDDLVGYEEQYEAINELMHNKISHFHSRTGWCSARDAGVVAVSSGVLGWLGAYLRNWSSWGQQAFAASGSLAHGLDPLSTLDEKLLPQLSSHLSQADLHTLTVNLQQGKVSATLWDTLTNLFGHKVGNSTNTIMMDNRWRALDDQGQSELFSKAFERGMPLTVDDSGWADLMKFLDRIYGYDNFAGYQQLIHQEWLPKVLQSLHDGTMTMDQFAALPQAQREIVTQSLFTAIQQEDIVSLLLDSPSAIVTPVVSPLDVVPGSGGSCTIPVLRSYKKNPFMD